MPEEFSILQEAARDDLPENMDDQGNPTPEERAEYVIQRLAQFIRDGRSNDGMPFKQWQDMARAEIANAVVDATHKIQKDDVVTKRLLFTMASALVTIGFWGTAFAFNKVEYLFTAVICTLAGLIMFAVALEWRVRKYMKKREADNRRDTLHRVEDLNRKIRRMEKDLKAQAKDLEKALKATAEGKQKWGG